MNKVRIKKFERIFSKPNNCEECIYCIEEHISEDISMYLCQPIKDKHGYTTVNLYDKVEENLCCRFKKDYPYKHLNFKICVNDK